MASLTKGKTMSDKMDVICHYVYDPRSSIFKTPANEKASYKTYHCSLSSCPLRQAGTCAMMTGIYGTRCPYGEITGDTGYTRRARKYGAWVSGAKGMYSDAPCFLERPPVKMAFIGDYVYLPYAHMTMCDDVPFRSHTRLLSGGSPFLPRDEWTISTVSKLVDFRPQAFLGGEIRSYQKEVVPRFLEHLREIDQDMWSRLVERNPHLDKKPDYVGRKALLRTLKPGIDIRVSYAQNEDRTVIWHWDGEQARTSSESAYYKIWGGIDADEVSVVIVPSEKAQVEVQSNDWVTDNTVFID